MELKQAIVVRADLGMGKGKIAAQASHASVLVLDKVDRKIVEDWKNRGMKKIVLKAGSEKEILELFNAAKKELPCALIRDAGFTQIESGSVTAIAAGPAEEKKIDRYFGHLKLL